MLHTLRDIVCERLRRAREQPVDLLLRPGIKAVVIIGLLTVAAQVAQQSPSERKILAKNATGFKASKAPVTTGSAKR